MMLDNYYDEDAVAERLATTPTILKMLRIKGTGPAYVLVSPKCVRYPERDLVAWLDARKYTQTDQYEKTVGQPRKRKAAPAEGGE
jgi:hypothetical protein